MKSLITLLLTITLTSGAFAQLPNYNMHVIANRNDYPIPPQFNPPWSYAAIWGYVDNNGREYAILGAGLGTIYYDVTDSAGVKEIAAFLEVG